MIDLKIEFIDGTVKEYKKLPFEKSEFLKSLENLQQKNKMFYFDNPENNKISEIILFNNIKTMQAT